MADVHKILSFSGIQYMTFNETLLTTQTNKGLSSYSNSLSIAVFKSQQKRLMPLKNIFENCGYTLSKTKKYYTLEKENQKSYMKIFVYPRELKLQKTDFGSFKVFIPQNYEVILQKMFGENYMSIVVVHIEKDDYEQITLENPKNKPYQPYEPVNRSCVYSSMCLRNKNPVSPKKYIVKLNDKSKLSGGCQNQQVLLSITFDFDCGVYVINCDIHQERMDKFKKFASIANLNYCREPCVKGKEFTYNLFCEMRERGLLTKTADMNAIEVAINMSHYNIWTRIVNAGYDYGLILEDDCEVKPDFVSKVNNIVMKLKEKEIDFSILFLYAGNWMKTISKQKKVLEIEEDGIKIMKETVPYNNGCVAYIMSNEFAKFMMTKAYPISVPQDLLLGRYHKHGNHLIVKMKREGFCYHSPLLDNPCDGEGGTGKTTQDYSAPPVSKIVCKRCE